MLPRATENAVVGHMRPAGLQLDHTVLYYRHHKYNRHVTHFVTACIDTNRQADVKRNSDQ